MLELQQIIEKIYNRYSEIIKTNLPLFVDRFCRIILALIWYIVIASFLNPDEYGLLISILSFTTAFFITTDMFVPCYIKWNEEKSYILFNHILVTLPLFVIIYILFHFYHFEQYYWFAVFCLILDTLGDAVRGDLTARENFKRLAILRFVSYLIYVIFSLILVFNFRITGILFALLLSKLIYVLFLRFLPKIKLTKKYYKLGVSGLMNSIARILNNLLEPAILITILPFSDIGSLFLNKKLFLFANSIIIETLGISVQPKIAKKRYKTALKYIIVSILAYIIISFFIFVSYKLKILNYIFKNYKFELKLLFAFFIFSLFWLICYFLNLILIYEEKFVNISIANSLPILYWAFIILLFKSLEGILIAYSTMNILRLFLLLIFTRKIIFRK